MKLEDLFKTKEPTNYVEQSSQGDISPLQQFLKERTPKPVTIAAPTPKASAPIEQRQIDQIKAEYSPVMTEQPTSDYSMQSSYTRTPSGDSYIPVSELLDTEKIRKQAEELSPKAGIGDILASLTPLAVEAIFGGGQARSVAAGISGESILGDMAQRQKRKQTLEDKLMELKKLSAPKADTEAGKQSRFETAQKQRQSNEDRRIILQTRDKLNQDKQFNVAKTRYSATNDAINVLNQRNPIGDAGVKTLFAKGIFGEVGNLNLQERADFIGSPELNRVFDRLLSRFNTGLLGEADRSDLLKLAKHMRERAKKDTQRIASGYTAGLQSVGLDPSSVIQPLLKTEDIAPQFSMPRTPKTLSRKGKDGKIYTYTLNEETGKYE